MQVYLDYQTGAGWEEITQYVRDNYSVTHRASSDEYHYAVNVANFTVKYNADIFSKIRAAHAAHTNVLVKFTRILNSVETTFFYGYYDTNTTITYDGLDYMQTIAIEAQDFTDYLDVEVGDPGIAYEDFSIMNATASGTSIVHHLFSKVGLSHDLIDSSVVLSDTIGAFTSESEDDTVLNLLDTLLHEHGYVANWNTEGKFSPVRWIPASGTVSSFIFTDLNIVGEIEESQEASNVEGAQVIWYGLDEKTNTRIYTEDLPFDSDGDFEGYAVLTEVYFPPVANVVDETTGDLQVVYQEYDDTGIQYKTSRYVQENYALDFSLEHADFSEILITRDHTIEDHYDAGLTRDTTTFYNKKARIRYYNPNLTSRWLYYMNINATVIYKRSQQKCTVENVANTGKLLKYESSYIFERAVADNLCKALANNVNQGTNKWTFKSEEEVDEGSFVSIVLNNGSTAYGFILERTYDGLYGAFSYVVRGVGYTFNAVARRYVIESTITNAAEISRLEARPATPILQINGEAQFTYTGAFTIPYPLSLSLAIYVDGANATSYQWYARDAGGVDQIIAGATNPIISIAHNAAYLLNPATIISCLVNGKWSTSITLLKKVVNTYRVQLTGGVSSISYDKDGENPAPAAGQVYTATYYINDVAQVASYAWTAGGCVTISGASNVQNMTALINPSEQTGPTYIQCTATVSGNAIVEREDISIGYYDSTLDWATEWDATKERMYTSDILIGRSVIASRMYAGELENDPSHIGYKRLKTGFAIGNDLQIKTPSGTQEKDGIIAVQDGVIKVLIETNGNAEWGGTITTSGLNSSIGNINDTLTIGDDGWIAAQGDLRTVVSEEGVATQAYIGGNWIEKTFIGSTAPSVYGLDLPDGAAIKWKNGDIQLVQTGSTVTVSGAVFQSNIITAMGGFLPDTNNGAYLGNTLLGFSVLHLAEGASINWDNGDATLTQTGNMVTLAGADFTTNIVIVDSGITPDANDGAYLGTASFGFSDLFLAEGAVINWDNGDVTLTQTGDNLGLVGGSFGVGRNNPATLFEVYGNHYTTRVLLYAATGQASPRDTSYLHLWASEPSLTYTGVGISNNWWAAVGGGSWERITTTRGGSYIRLLESQILFNVIDGAGTNTSAGGIDSTGHFVANIGIIPDANDGAYLGTASLGFSDLFLAEGAVINWDNGDCTLTQAGDVLTLAGADFVAPNLTATTAFLPDANDGAALGTTALQFSDLFLAEGGVINWDNGDVTLTQSGDNLGLVGGKFGIGRTSPGCELEVYGGHSSTRALLYAVTGQAAPDADAFLHLWASEPALSYTGVGISNNWFYNAGASAWTRNTNTRGGSFIRLLDAAIQFNIVSAAGVNIPAGGIDSSGNLSVPNLTISSGAGGNVRDGTYTPTVTAFGNIDAISVVGVCNWIRIGNRVFVTGTLSINATLYNTAGAFTMTLPIASNITETYDVQGVLGEGDTGRGGHFTGIAVGDTAAGYVFPGSAAAQYWGFNFSYTIK
jgi:hypothetical protein